MPFTGASTVLLKKLATYLPDEEDSGAADIIPGYVRGAVRRFEIGGRVTLTPEVLWFVAHSLNYAPRTSFGIPVEEIVRLQHPHTRNCIRRRRRFEPGGEGAGRRRDSAWTQGLRLSQAVPVPTSSSAAAQASATWTAVDADRSDPAAAVALLVAASAFSSASFLLTRLSFHALNESGVTGVSLDWSSLCRSTSRNWSSVISDFFASSSSRFR